MDMEREMIDEEVYQRQTESLICLLRVVLHARVICRTSKPDRPRPTAGWKGSHVLYAKSRGDHPRQAAFHDTASRVSHRFHSSTAEGSYMCSEWHWKDTCPVLLGDTPQSAPNGDMYRSALLPA